MRSLPLVEGGEAERFPKHFPDGREPGALQRARRAGGRPGRRRQKRLDLPPGGGYTVGAERRWPAVKINEVEALVGITKKNIRFYEEKGLLTPRRNSENGYRE